MPDINCSLVIVITIIIIIINNHHYYTNMKMIIFPASPEVTMDQQWRSAADGAVQVKIDCTVHSNPPSQVIILIVSMIMSMISMVSMIMYVISIMIRS